MDGLSRLNASSVEDARSAFTGCCGSTRWVEAMIQARPFVSREALQETARSAWRSLDREDWLEAFARHPRIGDREATRAKFAGTWAAGEQSATAGASDDTVEALAAANREYEQRFGHVFIVCATGRSAESMLEALRARMGASPFSELRTAAGEQEKITSLRLDKWLSEAAE